MRSIAEANCPCHREPQAWVVHTHCVQVDMQCTAARSCTPLHTALCVCSRLPPPPTRTHTRLLSWAVQRPAKPGSKQAQSCRALAALVRHTDRDRGVDARKERRRNHLWAHVEQVGSHERGHCHRGANIAQVNRRPPRRSLERKPQVAHSDAIELRPNVLMVRHDHGRVGRDRSRRGGLDVRVAGVSDPWF